MADYGNVQKSYNKARKGKRYRKDVIRFTKEKEENLKRVREDILTQEYKPGTYHYFKVYEPKERQIMALPFYDRVVQHAINNVLEPIFNKRFIFHSYACRKKKGMHKASETLQGWLYGWKKVPWGRTIIHYKGRYTPLFPKYRPWDTKGRNPARDKGQRGLDTDRPDYRP